MARIPRSVPDLTDRMVSDSLHVEDTDGLSVTRAEYAIANREIPRMGVCWQCHGLCPDWSLRIPLTRFGRGRRGELCSKREFALLAFLLHHSAPSDSRPILSLQLSLRLPRLRGTVNSAE